MTETPETQGRTEVRNRIEANEGHVNTAFQIGTHNGPIYMTDPDDTVGPALRRRLELIEEIGEEMHSEMRRTVTETFDMVRELGRLSLERSRLMGDLDNERQRSRARERELQARINELRAKLAKAEKRTLFLAGGIEEAQGQRTSTEGELNGWAQERIHLYFGWAKHEEQEKERLSRRVRTLEETVQQAQERDVAREALLKRLLRESPQSAEPPGGR